MSSNWGRISPVCGSSLLPKPLSCYSLDDHLLDLTGPMPSSSSSGNNTPNCPLGTFLHPQSFQLQWDTHRCAQVHNPSPHSQTLWLERLPGSSQWPVQANHIDHWRDSGELSGKRNSNTEDVDLELLTAALPFHGKSKGISDKYRANTEKHKIKAPLTVPEQTFPGHFSYSSQWIPFLIESLGPVILPFDRIRIQRQLERWSLMRWC